MTDPADGERQMRPVPPQNLTMRSGAATGADSSSSPTDMDCAPPYNMKQMEIPHSKRREWRCEGFEYHSRPFNLVSRYGVKPGLTSRQLFGLRSGHTILPNASAWSARARARFPIFLLGRRGAIRVRKPCRLEPAPARCTVRVANRGPRPVSYGGGEGFGARVSSDARRWRGGAAHAVYGGILQIPGPSHSPEACTEGIQARPRTCGGESGAPGVS